MWIVDRDTLAVLRANLAACQRYGYSLEQWLLIRFSRSDRHSIILEGPPASDGTIPGIDLVGHPVGTEDQTTILVTGRDRRLGARPLLAGGTTPLSELIKVLPAAVCVCDATGAIALYNDMAVEMWGRDPGREGPPDLFCGSLALFQRDGTPMPHSESPMAETLHTGISILNREVVIDRPDGSRVRASVSVAPLRDEDGAQIGAINCFQDITEHRRAEDDLRRLASFSDLNPSPVLETDLDGRPRYLNPAARREFPDLESLGPAHPLLRQVLDHCACDELVGHCVGETTLGARTYEWRAGRFPGEGRIIVHASDLTDHRRALDALGTSERRFRALLEQAADAIYEVGPDGRLLDVNQRACRSLGYTQEELKTMSVGDIDPLTLADQIRDIWTRVSLGESVTVEGNHRRKDGTTFPVEVSVGLIETEARPVMLALARDITVRRRLEAERRQGQRLEALGQLAGGIAHDFNNLLTVILGSGDLLRQKWPAAMPGREEVEDICKAAVRAAALTQQLLAFSRRQVLKSDVLELNTIVTDMATLLHRVIGETIDIQTTLASNLGAIRADRGQIEQVITNLAVNARDAMPKGGILRIATASVMLDPAMTDTILDAPPGPTCHFP